MENQKTVPDSISNSLLEYVGKDVADLIKELQGEQDYSEFKLADALGKELNATRNLLYKLHSLNLASFIKKKDNKIGWYIYYWTFHEDKVNSFLLNQKRSKLESLKEHVAREGGGSFYSCLNNCARLDFDKAVEFSFRCPECGELMGQEDNEKINVGRLADEIGKLEQEIRKLELAVEAEKNKSLADNLSNESVLEKGKSSKDELKKNQDKWEPKIKIKNKE